MYCKHCMRMIDDDAEFCPACGKPQKGKSSAYKKPIYKRWWFWVIIVILFIGFTGGSGDPELVDSNGGSISNVNDDPQQTATQYFTIGDTAKLDEVYVTLVNVTQSRGSEYFTASDGNVYVLWEFTIENNSDAELNISSLLCFDAYVDDYSTSISLSAESSSDKNPLDGTIAPGKKMNGVIGYEVPQDWKTFEVHFTPDFWSGDGDFIFTCQN